MTKDQPRVLVVEDEPALAEGLAEALGFQGYDVDVADDGERGLDLAMRRGYDVMLLDVMLPRLDGFEVLRRLRAAGRTVPTILLTAKGAEEDRVRGLETGADDYVTKPFALRELVARVAAQIRRTRRERHEGDVFEADGMRFDLGRLVVQKDGEEIVLTPREGEIIAYLRSKQGNVVTREAFLLDVWRYPTATVETRTVDNTLAALRRKIEGSAEPRLILTVRGKGYRWGGG
ncbi:MAG: response regulator transcription factor [Planctomycetes bacterium]|nr:response regulator transcription factor [Planctomycetota bacterium]MCB9828423.1 response regulator transcription factor [Planctomycetota bacterium]MCB9902496.1 response regulator transcription factor [Planctomycetota bacterium]